MPRTPPLKFDRARAAQMRAEGLTYRAIGAALGVSAMAVHYALNSESRGVVPGFERFAILGKGRARPPR